MSLDEVAAPPTSTSNNSSSDQVHLPRRPLDAVLGAALDAVPGSSPTQAPPAPTVAPVLAVPRPHDVEAVPVHLPIPRYEVEEATLRRWRDQDPLFRLYKRVTSVAQSFEIWVRDRVAMLGIGTALFSATSQHIRWSDDITGVAFSWPVVGFTSALIKLVLLSGLVTAVKHASDAQVAGAVRNLRSSRWVWNQWLAITILCTNVSLGGRLLSLGVDPLHDANSVWLGAIWMGTLVSLCFKWRTDSPDQRLLRFATGFTIVPLVVQGKDYLLYGPGGMPMYNLAVLILLMAVFAWVAPSPAGIGLRGKERKQAIKRGDFTLYQLTRREVVMHILCLAVPAVVGGMIHHNF